MFIKTLSNRFYQGLKSKVEGTHIQSFRNEFILFCFILLITIIINSLADTSKNNYKQSKIIKETTCSNLNNPDPESIIITKKSKRIIIKNQGILIYLKNPKVHLNGI